jgi:hypothetical protein
MIKVIDNNRSLRWGPVPLWLRHAPLPLLLILLGGYSPVASAGFDVESCLQIQDELTVQLHRKFKRTDKTGLADRRKQLNHLAQSASNHCAWMLLYKLAKFTKHRDPEFRELITARLAEPTIRQFTAILAGQACCAEDDLEDWGRKFETDAEREAYIVNYFDEFFDDLEPDGTQSQSADPDVDCTQASSDVTAQLSRKFRSTDKKGLADRRKKLNRLFENTSIECAYMLSYWLGNEKHGDHALQKLFNGKLASPTRKELIAILKRRIHDHMNEPFS